VAEHEAQIGSVTGTSSTTPGCSWNASCKSNWQFVEQTPEIQTKIRQALAHLAKEFGPQAWAGTAKIPMHVVPAGQPT
jgi:hypothetical protein